MYKITNIYNTLSFKLTQDKINVFSTKSFSSLTPSTEKTNIAAKIPNGVNDIN